MLDDLLIPARAPTLSSHITHRHRSEPETIIPESSQSSSDIFLLRPILEQDFDALYELDTDEIVKQFVGGVTRHSRDEWYLKAPGLLNRNYEFTLVYLKTGEFAGHVTMGHYGHSREGREIYVFLAKPFIGHQLGEEACRIACAHAFSALGAERVVGVVDVKHDHCIQLMKRMNFQEIEALNEGVSIKRVFQLRKPTSPSG